MPKLHFYDTGLVCWLLGIRTPEHLRSHPLRGAIFETWVVSEIAKQRANLGEPGGLSFYRDRNGVEIDLLIDRPDGITLVEAKSAITPSSSFLRVGRTVRRHMASIPRPSDILVVYGGDEPQIRSDGVLLPWRLLHENID